MNNAGPSDDGSIVITYDLSLLDGSRRKWTRSSGLRLVYGDIFNFLISCAYGESWLELGAGVGIFKQRAPHLITSDIVKTPYVDIAVSAYDVLRAGRRWDTIFAFDMLHHLQEPLRFFTSAASALVQGGRIVLVEPAATCGGRWFYKTFHHEPIDPFKIQAPYVFGSDSTDGGYANMGMGWALFIRDQKNINRLLADVGLKIVSVRFRDVLAYAATGGFSGPQLLPTWAIRGLLWVERRLPQFLLRKCALRMIIILEKKCA